MKLLLLVLAAAIASEVHYELEPVYMPDPPTPAANVATHPTYQQQPRAYPYVQNQLAQPQYTSWQTPSWQAPTGWDWHAKMNTDPEGREWHRLDNIQGGYGHPLQTVQIGIDWNGDGVIENSELHNITRPASLPISHPQVYSAPQYSVPQYSAPQYSAPPQITRAPQPQYDNYGNIIPENPNV
jgi:hypothetical protein